MKQLYIRVLKCCLLGFILLGSHFSKAQISYWSPLTVSNPFHPSDGLLGCMTYKNGNLYVPFFDYYGHTLHLAVLSNGNWQTYTVPQSFDTTQGIVYGDFYAIAADRFGNVYMAGGITDTSGAIVIKWDGFSFTKVGPNTGAGALHTNNHSPDPFDNNVINNICIDQAGNLYVGGYFADALANHYIAKWNGTAWSTVGFSANLLPQPFSGMWGGPTLLAQGNNLYCTPGYNGKGLMFWNGSTWANIDTTGGPLDITSFVIGPSGTIYAGAYNDTAYMYNGTSWSVMGHITGYLTGFRRMFVDSSENVYFTGYPTDAAGNYYIGKWDGSQWSELGVNNYAIHATYFIYDIESLPGGDIISCGGNMDGDGNPYVAVCHTLPANRLGISLSATSSNCSNNGSITSAVVHGTPPYKYAWSTGDTTANVDSLSGGSYYVTVTDSTGLIATGYTIVPGSCLSVITGKIFLDTSGICLYNGTQPAVAGVTLALNGGGTVLYAYTDSGGNYTFRVSDTGNYILNVAYQAGGCGRLISCNNLQAGIYIDSLGDSSSGNNFRLDSTGGSFDFVLYPGWGAASPGQQKAYWMAPVNLSSVPYHGAVNIAFTYDPVLTYDSSSAPGVVDTALHTVTWTISGDSVPFRGYVWNRDRYIAYFTLPASVSDGYPLHSSFLILPDSGDCNPSNNALSFVTAVLGSHDPNYKEVSPSGNLIPNDSILTYTIHFQNTGTDSTFFITVTDTLSQYLNPATVLNLASSLPYTSFTISGIGVLTWSFNPCYLPDSATSLQGSQGFITFSVHKKTNVPFGTAISNKAFVYFDYNQPVITNYATDSVVSGLSYTYQRATICFGDTFYSEGQFYTLAGNYADTLTNILGYDSIVILTVTVNHRDTIELFRGLCNHDSVYFYGRYIHDAGTYDTLLAGGCDTLVILTVVIHYPIPPVNLYDTICANERFLFNGTYVDTTGIYTAHLSSGYGCDSTVKLHLTVNPNFFHSLNSTICTGDTFYVGHFVHTQGGNYTDTLTNALGCDSIVNLTLSGDSVPHPAFTSLTQLCAGQNDTVVFTGSGTNQTYFTWNFDGGNIVSGSAEQGPYVVKWETGGTHFISINMINVCGIAADTVRVSIHSLPVVTLGWDSMVILNRFSQLWDTAFCSVVQLSNSEILSGGKPAGGYYSGIGVWNNIVYIDSIPWYMSSDTIIYTYTDSNHCSASSYDRVNINICEGIQQTSDNNAITLHPNPTTDQLYIKTENIQPETLSIYDVNGRMIYTMPFKPEVDVNQLSSGVYFVEVKSNSLVARKRFVKM